MNFTLCTVGGCSQYACRASGDDKLCGVHRKLTLAHRATVDEKDDLLRLLDDHEYSEVLRRLIERSFQ